MPRRVVRAATGALVTALLTGCGLQAPALNTRTQPTAPAASEPTASEPTTSSAAESSATAPTVSPTDSASPAPSRTATQPTTPSGLSDLARAAESAATGSREVPDPRRAGADGKELIGADAGWPQCPAGMGIEKKKSHGGPMPREDSAFVTLGLTNGPGFTPNPCLASQVAWVRERSMPLGAYAVVSQPSAAQVRQYGVDGPYRSGTRLDRLRNAGHAQARYNLASMRSAGMLTGPDASGGSAGAGLSGAGVPGVWVDVEPVPDFDWGTDLRANAAVVEGTVRAYRDAGLRVGVYSTPALWRRVVGDLRLDLPEWRAAGQTSAAEARSRCGSDWVIQGGDAVLGQWVEDNRDRNLLCPGQQGALADWFA